MPGSKAGTLAPCASVCGAPLGVAGRAVLGLVPDRIPVVQRELEEVERVEAVLEGHVDHVADRVRRHVLPVDVEHEAGGVEAAAGVDGFGGHSRTSGGRSSASPGVRFVGSDRLLASAISRQRFGSL